MVAGHRTQIKLRVQSGDDDVRAYLVEFADNATVASLSEALASQFGVSPESAVLADPIHGVTFGSSSLLVALQFQHGQILELVTSEPEPYAVELRSGGDILRVVHESGPQLGHAWPLSPSTGKLACWRTGCRARPRLSTIATRRLPL